MLIKQQALPAHLKQTLASVYILFGQDPYLLNKYALDIKAAWKKDKEDVQETILTIQNPSDWSCLATEANSFSLFSNHTLLDVRYDKKSLDAQGKAFFTHYLSHLNPSCLLLLRASQLTQKQLAWLPPNNQAVAVAIQSLSITAMQQWIAQKLRESGLSFQPDCVTLIQRYTQGNMLACAQIIEKLNLILEPNATLTTEQLSDLLVDQCEYSLFELASACLSQQPEKVLQLLRYCAQSKVEPSLVLWLLAQEIRLLIQLYEKTKQGQPFSAACSQLKIWSQKMSLYQSALSKANMNLLGQLLQRCQAIDHCIKTNSNSPIWSFIEQIALSFCLAKPLGMCE